MNEYVSKLEIIGVNLDGTRFSIIAKIGKPYVVDGKYEEWACPISLEPLHKSLCDIHGIDSFQALYLASKLIIDLLKDFKEKGGKLQYMTGEEFALEGYNFG